MLRKICLQKWLRITKRPEHEIMNSLSKSLEVEIAHCFNKSLQAQHLYHLVLYPQILQDYKGRASTYTSKGSASGNQIFPTCTKCGENHSDECAEGRKGCFRCGQFDHRYFLGKVNVVTQIALSVQLHHTNMFPNLTGSFFWYMWWLGQNNCILFKLTMTKKILPMWSMVHWEFLI